VLDVRCSRSEVTAVADCNSTGASTKSPEAVAVALFAAASQPKLPLEKFEC
jgi:hypothetical protein